MSRDDASYYRQRAVDHRAMALAADRRNVREIHEELARQYDALVEQARAGKKLDDSGGFIDDSISPFAGLASATLNGVRFIGIGSQLRAALGKQLTTMLKALLERRIGLLKLS